MNINYEYIFAAAFGAIGAIEWAKGFFPGMAPFAWRLLMPVVCVGVAAAGGGNIQQMATNAVLILAVSQVGYEALISRIKKQIGG